MSERPERFGVTGQGVFTREWILEVVTAHDASGGVGIVAIAAETDRSIPNVRHHLAQLRKDGLIVRNRDGGPGVRYRLPHEPEPVWAVLVDEQGQELGRVEIAEDLRFGPFPGERRLHALAWELVHVARGEAPREGDEIICALCGRRGHKGFHHHRRGMVCDAERACYRRRQTEHNAR